MSADAEISYRQAASSDRPSVVELLRSCGLPSDDLPPELLDFIVARSGSALVGSVGLELFGPDALLRSLAVAPAWRGRGISRVLWSRARAQARAAGVKHLYLLTTTAEPLFARWGFARTSRDTCPPAVRNTSEFSSLCPSSAAFMRIDVP